MQRGILGGTFDPPHLVHMFAGEAAYRDLGLDVVTYVPNGSPWQKAGRSVSPSQHRWRMTKLAVAGVPYFEASDVEINRPGWTYTIDTLEEFGEGDDVTLILGADAARSLPSWNRADDVRARVRIAIVPRPSDDRRDVDAALDGWDCVWLDTPAVYLSGTMLRKRGREGRSLRFLVREAVWEYIQEHQVYNDGA